MSIFLLHYLPLSEDTELEKWMTDGQAEGQRSFPARSRDTRMQVN